MRRRALTMTMSAVTVAVLILGIPGILLGCVLQWENARANLYSDATRLMAAVDRRLYSGDTIASDLLSETIASSDVTTYIRVEYDNGKVISQGVRPDIDDALQEEYVGTNGATILVEGSRSALLASLATFVFISLIGILISFTAAIALARWQSRRISAPLIYLAAAAEQIGAGQTRPRMRESGIEEIDLVYEELVRTAERMAGRIAAERQFAADASHQLRTPLTALSMRLEEIEYLSDQQEVREEAASCLEQVERLTAVVADLLSNSRAVGASTEAIMVERIFDQQRDEWERSFTQAGRGLTFSSERSLAVLAPPGALAQVIATLLENSLKYGAGTTQVSARKVGKGVMIDVVDEGEGVEDELREAIFTKGFSTGGSTGIGLPLARSLAESAGGRLELAQTKPALFRIILSAVPQTINPEKILPPGTIISMGSRRRRR